MRVNINMGGNQNVCTFAVQNTPMAQFDGGVIKVLHSQGKDVNEELYNMLTQSLMQRNMIMTEEHKVDLRSVVEQYTEIMLRN